MPGGGRWVEGGMAVRFWPTCISASLDSAQGYIFTLSFQEPSADGSYSPTPPRARAVAVEAPAPVHIYTLIKLIKHTVLKFIRKKKMLFV